jgi:Uma2 family endonuclease
MRLAFVRESDLDRKGDAMTTAVFSTERPMTEAEFVAIGETPERIELFDGSLHVSPGPTPRHQKISFNIAATLSLAAEPAGLQALEAVNVRLGATRIPIPDIVIVADIDLDELVIDASVVRFACEIISPSSASIDKVLKMHYYATAAIPVYLLVDPKARTFSLYRLDGDHYVEESVCGPGEVLRLSEPVVATLDPAELLPPL